jgi:hypothetical protein
MGRPRRLAAAKTERKMRRSIDRKRFGLGTPNRCFQNAGRLLLEHGPSDKDLRYCEGNISGLHHGWLEDAKTRTIYAVTIPTSFEVRSYKDGVPQEWKAVKTNHKPQDYVAIIRLSLIEYLIQNLKQGWKPATCALLNEDGTPDLASLPRRG